MIESLTLAFEEARNEKRAAYQRGYLKGLFPFLGIEKPIQKKISLKIFLKFPQVQWDKWVEALFLEKEREYHYAAIDLAMFNKKKWSEGHLELFTSLVRQNSWWDTVDPIATHLIGKLLLKYPALIGRSDSWIEDPNLWIRRTALIFQLFWKKETDEPRLFSFCLKRAHEKEFFIRKAIGWSLRQYGKSSSGSVKGFLSENRQCLSPLSFREASRRLEEFS